MDTHNPVVTTTTTTDNRYAPSDKGDAANGIALKTLHYSARARNIAPPPHPHTPPPSHLPRKSGTANVQQSAGDHRTIHTQVVATSAVLWRIECTPWRSVTFHSALIAGVDFTACDVQWRTHSISTFTPTRFLPFLRQETQNTCDEHVQKRPKGTSNCLRPYHAESTGSRPITEVKQRRARLVLGWVTAWEYRVP